MLVGRCWVVVVAESCGVAGFVIVKGDRELARVPEKPVGKFGRPLFQRMPCHDTPEFPLPRMKHIDHAASKKELARYSVQAVNSVQPVSKATPSQQALTIV